MASSASALRDEQGLRVDLSLRLWYVALALLVVFAATVLNAALPLRLLDPRWLQGLGWASAAVIVWINGSLLWAVLRGL